MSTSESLRSAVAHAAAAARSASRDARKDVQRLQQTIDKAETDSLERYEARRERIAADIQPPATDDSPEAR